MNFREIKKVLFSRTPFPKLPEEEKETARKVIFMSLVSFFVFVAIVGYTASPSNFFHDSSNKIEILLFLAWFIYFSIRLYNIIQAISRGQVVNEENLEMKAPPNSRREVIKKFILSTVLPLVIISMYLLIKQWLKNKNLVLPEP